MRWASEFDGEVDSPSTSNGAAPRWMRLGSPAKMSWSRPLAVVLMAHFDFALVRLFLMDFKIFSFGSCWRTFLQSKRLVVLARS